MPPIAAASGAQPVTSSSSTEDEDLALALALQDEELRGIGGSGLRLGGTTSSSRPGAAGVGSYTKVQVLTREEQASRNAAWATKASKAQQRKLYSAADADDLVNDASAEGFPALGARKKAPQQSSNNSNSTVSSAGGHQFTSADAVELRAALREHSEEALYQALKGSGRRAGYLAVQNATATTDGEQLGPQQAAAAAAGGNLEGGAAGGTGPSATNAHGNVTSLGADGYLTKHDPYLSGRRNARALERKMGSSSGDMSRVTVSQAAVSGLQRFMQRQSVKGTAAHGRVESAAHATSESVLDSRTRMTLFKLLGSGRFDAVSGVIATGKEANVYLGCRWHPDVHAELSHAGSGGGGSSGGWAAQKSRRRV